MKINSVRLKNGERVKMVYLTKQDKKNIKNMCKECNIYACFDNKEDADEVKKAMKSFKEMCENE